MANLTITPSDVAPVEILEQATAPASEEFNAGQAVTRVAATGKWKMANAATGGADVGNVRGIALRNADFANQAVTALIKGIVYLGAALDGVNFDAPIYLSDTDGTLADTAGTVSTVIGHVVPIFAETGTPKKALRLV